MRKTRRRKSPRKEQQHPKIKEEKKEKETKKWPLATRLLFGNGHHSKMFFLNIYFLFFWWPLLLAAVFLGFFLRLKENVHKKKPSFPVDEFVLRSCFTVFFSPELFNHLFFRLFLFPVLYSSLQVDLIRYYRV